MSSLISSAPAAWAALLGFVQTLAAAQNPAPTVFPAELFQYEPGSYIIVNGVSNHQFNWEAMGYEFIETYMIDGLCTVFTGSTELDSSGISATVMQETYDLFSNCVMTAVVDNRGGNGIPVLGITSPQPVYEIQPGFAQYTHGPGNMGGAQAGWQGVLRWSYTLKAYLSPEAS